MVKQNVCQGVLRCQGSIGTQGSTGLQTGFPIWEGIASVHGPIVKCQQTTPNTVLVIPNILNQRQCVFCKWQTTTTPVMPQQIHNSKVVSYARMLDTLCDISSVFHTCKQETDDELLRTQLLTHPNVLLFSDQSELTLLHWAVKNQQVSRVRFLAKRIVKEDFTQSHYAQWRSKSGLTPLHLALSVSFALESDWSIVETLLYYMPHLSNIPDEDGQIPLHYAASNGFCVPVVWLLDLASEQTFEITTKRGSDARQFAKTQEIADLIEMGPNCGLCDEQD